MIGREDNFCFVSKIDLRLKCVVFRSNLIVTDLPKLLDV